jgi:uncharacterized membrane protein
MVLMVTIHHPVREDTLSHIPVYRIGFDDIRWALRQGWEDFLGLRGDLIFVGLIYPFVGFIAVLVSLEQSLLPLLFPLAAGISLLGPLVAAGFYEMARRRELGQDIRWRHFFDVFVGPAAGPLLALGLVLAGLFVLWLAAAMSIYEIFFVDANLGWRSPGPAAAFIETLFTTPNGWGLIIVGNLVGLGFAIVALMISVTSFPMVVDRPDLGAATAIETSIRVFMRNPIQILTWGLIVAVLLVLGSIPLFVGLAAVLPVLGYATWHLYTRAVEREELVSPS